MNYLFYAAFAILLFYCLKKAYNNTKDIVINNIDINQDKTSGKINPTLTILQLSDLHLENISVSPAELYEKLKDKPIDLIALTGDFLDRTRTFQSLSHIWKS